MGSSIFPSPIQQTMRRKNLDEGTEPAAEEKKNGLRQRCVRFLTNKRRWLIIILFYIFMILIPAMYSITSKLPPDDELLQSSGVLSFEYVPRKGTLTWLKTPNGDMLFTCRDKMGSSNDCYLKKEVEQRIQGKFATILWYRHPIYFWTEQNRLVELRVNNEAVISRETTQNDLNRHSKWAIWQSIILFIAFIGIDIFFSRLYKKKRINNE